MAASIEFNPLEIEVLQAKLRFTSKQMNFVLRTAVNKTAKVGRTRFRNAIGEVLNLQRKDLNRAIDFSSATNETGPVASIFVTRYLIPLRGYKPRQVSRGLAVQFSKIGAAQLILGAFIAPMPSNPGKQDGGDGQSIQAVRRSKHLPSKGINAARGFRWVRLRWGKEGGRTVKQKLGMAPRGVAWSLSLTKLFGPNVLSQFVDKGALTKLATHEIGNLDKQLVKDIRSQIDFLLSGKADQFISGPPVDPNA